MTPETRYAKSGEVFIALVTGQGPETLGRSSLSPGREFGMSAEHQDCAKGRTKQDFENKACTGCGANTFTF